jgi:hypothetical protein
MKKYMIFAFLILMSISSFAETNIQDSPGHCALVEYHDLLGKLNKESAQKYVVGINSIDNLERLDARSSYLIDAEQILDLDNRYYAWLQDDSLSDYNSAMTYFPEFKDKCNYENFAPKK